MLRGESIVQDISSPLQKLREGSFRWLHHFEVVVQMTKEALGGWSLNAGTCGGLVEPWGYS